MTSISKNKERFGNSNQKDAITATKSTAIFSDVETRQATASVFGGRLSLIYYNIKAIWGQSQNTVKQLKRHPRFHLAMSRTAIPYIGLHCLREKFYRLFPQMAQSFACSEGRGRILRAMW